MKSWRNVLWAGGVCAIYVATSKLGLKYAVVGQTVTLLWPPSGIALAAVLMGGYRLWPGIALGAFLANAGTGIPILPLAMIVLGNTLEPLCGALLLKRQRDFSNALDNISDVLAFILLAAGLSTAVSASLGACALLASKEIGIADFGATWLSWWLGDGLGILVISPVLLTGIDTLRKAPTPLFSAKTAEALALIVSLAVVGQAIFGNADLAGLGYFPVCLAMFPFAIWSGLRFGSFAAASATLFASLLAIRGTVLGTGPFVVGSAMDSLIRWCLFADLMAITGLLLGAVSSERERALAALRRSNEDLEFEVRKRTEELIKTNLKLQQALNERRRLLVDMNQIGEERLKMIGQELHDGLGQQLTGIALMITSLNETLGNDCAAHAGRIHQVDRLLEEAITLVRSLSRGLYPVALETGGLSSALNHLADHARSFSSAQCFVRTTPGVSAMDRITALNLYRIAQEAVCNAVRHGKAQRIDIELSGVGEQFCMAVKDNGVGFKGQYPQTKETLGLRSMQCRADLIGAALQVRDSPDGGVSVLVTGPANAEVQSIVRQ